MDDDTQLVTIEVWLGTSFEGFDRIMNVSNFSADHYGNLLVQGAEGRIIGLYAPGEWSHVVTVAEENVVQDETDQ